MNLSLGNLDLCPGEPVLFDAGAGYVNYLWSNGSTSQFITPTTAGNYSVTVIDPNGCSGNASATLTFFTAPTVSAGPATQDLCNGDTLQLTASGSFPSYLWSNGSIGALLDVTSPGSYTVTATDGNGCEATATVTVNGLAAPLVSLGNDTVLCDGGTYLIDAGAGFTNYLWSDGSSAQTLLAIATGTYSVTVTGSNGCEASDEITLSVSPPIVEDLGPPTLPLCEGSELILDAGEGLQTYAWSNGFTNDQYLVVTDSGQYAVTVTESLWLLGERQHCHHVGALAAI